MASDGRGFNNLEVAKLLRSVAAAKQIKKGNMFEIRAYSNAGDSVEHLTSEVKDLWAEGRLGEVPGLGKSLQGYLDEYFKSGKVKHFLGVQAGIEPVVFDLLEIPGVGPKTAQELAKLGVKSLESLNKLLTNGELIKRGLSQKMAGKIRLGLNELEGRTDRMLLPYACLQAEKILAYLKKGPGVEAADPLGSLRRRVATIGDLDFAAASKNPQIVIEYFTKMPGVSQIISQGENKASIVLNSGLHIDLLVGEPQSYGALLQHFTGGKNHNIKLRGYAQNHNLTLNEYGVKDLKTGKIIPTRTEKELYGLLKMEVPEPEIREDNGEVEAALQHKLPDLVELKDIKGDLHLHSNFPMVRPSHGPGVNSIEEIIKKAIVLGYNYVGVSDHPPGFRVVSKEQMVTILASRNKMIEKLRVKYTKYIRVLNGLEIDILPDGTLSVPINILKTLDYCIAGVHSGHRSSSQDITRRILTALESPYVNIISHPTGRLLNERESYQADWERIFAFAAANKKILEINAFFNRLDLRDDLVRLALKFGCKFVIDSDAHEVSQMQNMEYGVSVARRGWAEGKDIANTWEVAKLLEWFKN